MKIYVYLSIFLCFSLAKAQQPADQDISVELGKRELFLKQPFILSVIVKNNTNRPSVIFPDIESLEKRSASATSTTSTIGGKTVLVQTISQQYFVAKEGTYTIPDFTVTVDGVKVKSEGLKLTFKKENKDSESTSDEEEDSELITSEEGISSEDVFLSLRATKSAVYVREGFAVRLSLYVAKNAPIEMEFYQLDGQLQAILKKVRPATCWEENVGIEEIIQRDVVVNGRAFTEYQMYQAMFFPLTLQTVSFPSVGLDMLVLSAQEATAGKKKSVKKYSSSPVRILVKPLPPHPLRDQISVGEYQLRERITREEVSSGESLRYVFGIEGEGNLSTVMMTDVPMSQAFDFYPPDVSQTVRRSYQKVSGEKDFDYFIVAKQKGTYPLGRFFQWIYFDPSRSQYDTLRSTKTIRVEGENLISVNLSGGNGASVYESIEQVDTTVPYIDYQDLIRSLTNLVVVVLVGVMVWIFRK